MAASAHKKPNNPDKDDLVIVARLIHSMTVTDIRYGLKHCFGRACGLLSPALWGVEDNYDVLTQKILNRMRSPAFKLDVVLKQLRVLMPEYKSNEVPTRYLLAVLGAIDFFGNAKKR